MRWKIGSYAVKYNPKSNEQSWGAEQSITTNINGNTSNPNLVYNGTQNFTIDIYDKPTNFSSTQISGSYVSITEERMSDKLYLLKGNSTYDIMMSDGTSYGNVSITSGNGVSLPPTNPVSITHLGTEIAFLYKDDPSLNSTVLITDNNGVANRKYTYDSTSGDINIIDSICWDFNSTIYAVNPYGKVYAINQTNGTPTFVYEFGDYSENKASLSKKYTSVMYMEKHNSGFFGVMKNKSDILLFDNNARVVSKIEPKMNNIVDISHSNYSLRYFVIVGNKVHQMHPNTCRVDIEIIKEIVSSGQVTMYNENGFPSVISVNDLRVARNRNMQESKYEVSFSGEIAYSNQTFDNKWYKSNR